MKMIAVANRAGSARRTVCGNLAAEFARRDLKTLMEEIVLIELVYA